jgi:hypothetical protein
VKRASARFCRLIPLLLYIYICTTPVWKWNSIIVSDQRYPRGIVKKKRPFCLYAGRNGQNGEGVSTRQSRHRHQLLPHPNSGFLQLCSWPPNFYFGAAKSKKYVGSIMMMFLFYFSANTEEIVG